MIVLLMLILTVVIVAVVFFQNHTSIPENYKLFYKVLVESKPDKLFITKHRTRPDVPKIVHRIWLSGERSRCKSAYLTSAEMLTCGGRAVSLQSIIQKTRKVLPDWEQVFYDDDMIKDFMCSEFGPRHKVTQAYNLINTDYGAARSDLLRYLIVYKYGGLYIDVKSCVRTRLPSIPDDKDMIVSHWELSKISLGPQNHLFGGAGEYQNWYIYARPGAPILQDIIERVVDNILKIHWQPYHDFQNLYKQPSPFMKFLGLYTSPRKHEVLSVTGPIAMTLAIKTSPNRGDVMVMDSYTMTKYLKFSCTSWIRNLTDAFRSSPAHYANNITPVIKTNHNGLYIPNRIYIWRSEADPMPKHITDRISMHLPEFQVTIHDRSQGETFITDFYGDNMAKVYNGFESDAHRLALWKYCILYVYGGCYFDTRSVITRAASDVFTFTKKDTWYTSLDKNTSKIDNSVIATPPFNPFVKTSIRYMYDNRRPTDPEMYNENFHRTISSSIEHDIRLGNNYQTNSWVCILLGRHCDQNRCTVTPRRGKRKEVLHNNS